MYKYARYIMIVFSVLISSAALQASPVYTCFNDDNMAYTRVNRHINDLRTYSVAGGQLILAHCASKNVIRINETEKSPDLGHAYIVLLSMIADDQKQSLQDVVERLEYQNYDATLEPLIQDGCLCTEEH